MSTSLEAAVAKIESVGDRLCNNQVYYFEGVDGPLPDVKSLCRRLEIPETDDIVIEYPARRTFSPIAESKFASLSRQLKSKLPPDYVRLLAKFGAFHLPGKCVICFRSPDSIMEAGGQWGFDDLATMPVLAISHFHRDCDGDSMGFLRRGDSFGDELYHFKHDLRYPSDDPKLWTEKLAPSLSDFIVAYVNSLT